MKSLFSLTIVAGLFISSFASASQISCRAKILSAYNAPQNLEIKLDLKNDSKGYLSQTGMIISSDIQIKVSMPQVSLPSSKAQVMSVEVKRQMSQGKKSLVTIAKSTFSVLDKVDSFNTSTVMAGDREIEITCTNLE